MKNDRLVRKPDATAAFRARLLMVCFLFVAGVLLGLLAHGMVTAQDNERLRLYLLQFAQASADDNDPVASVLTVLQLYFRYPLLVLLCGLTAIGLVLAPLICMVQGFFLAFSVGCFASALGQDGVLLAMAVLGVRCIFTLPCTVYLAAQGMSNAYRRVRPEKKREMPAVLPERKQTAICFYLLMIGAAAELFVVPKLLDLVLAGIS